jgi:lipopolysaccharide export system permease protein
MRILDRYILRGMLISMLTVLTVMTFVMSLGAVLKLTGLIARGVPAMPILRLFLAGLPASLIFTLPISALVSSLLVFGRLSADGEITAMRASGVSLRRIIIPPLAIGAVLAVACVIINDRIAPRAHFEQRRTGRELIAMASMELLEEGRFIRQFDGLAIYVGRKNGANMETIRIYDSRTPGRLRTIDAASGTVRMGTNGTDIILELKQVQVDPVLEDRPGAGYMESWPIVIPNTKKGYSSALTDYDMTFSELRDRVDDTPRFFPAMAPKDLAVQRMTFLIELHRRWVLSLACVAFVALGVPLGIKAHRRESSVGVAISLGVVFIFHMFILAAGSLARVPEVQPHLILWVPVAVSLILAGFLIRRGD